MLRAPPFVLFAVATAVPLPVLGHLFGRYWLTPWLALGLPAGRPAGRQAPLQAGLAPAPPASTLALLQFNLYAYVPVHLGLIGWGAWIVAGGSLSAWQALGFDRLGGPGHRRPGHHGCARARPSPLAHRPVARAAAAGDGVLRHFHIEHNRGHHARVATPDDPSTARFGETLYAFLPRPVGQPALGLAAGGRTAGPP